MVTARSTALITMGELLVLLLLLVLLVALVCPVLPAVPQAVLLAAVLVLVGNRVFC
jgi:uncharacterized protein YqgC (DUF456 family)